MVAAGSASGVFAARYAGFIKGTTAGTVTWNLGYRSVGVKGLIAYEALS
jgi:hypothetical protein